ncbi:unnamed protein product, partial [Rangifer tarandus platyrhynchus]
MGARGRVREETGRGGRRGRGTGRGRGGGGGRKLDKLGLYPRARVSRFRLPPGGHHRGDRAAPYGRGASPRERHGGSPQPPVAAAASSRQRPGLGGGMRKGRLKMKWGGGEAPPNPRRTVAQGPDGPAFPLLPVGLSTPGAPRCGCSPRLGSTPLPTPPPSPPLAPGPAAAAALPAPEAAQCAQPHCGPAQTAKHLPLGRGGGVDQCVRARARAGWGLVGGGGRPGAEGGRGPAGPGTRASGAEEATGRAGEEQEKRGGGAGERKRTCV